MHLRKGEYVLVKGLVSGFLVCEAYSPRDKGRVATLGAKAAMLSGDAFLAQRFAEKALAFSQETEDVDTEARATFLMGAALVFIGDHGSARTFLLSVVNGFADRWAHMESELGARTYGNLGQTYREQKLYPNSLKAYTQALMRFEKANDTRGQVMVLHQMSWVLLQMGEDVEAEERLEQALDLGPLEGELSAFQIEHEMLLHLHRGENTAALEKSQEILTEGRPGVTAGNRALALWASAEVSRRVGHYHEATMLAKLAQEQALEARLSRVLNLVSTLLAEIHKAENGA